MTLDTTPAASGTGPIAECDLLVVGAGIVGLAHAAEAVRRGLRVVIIDRDARAVGASVRNFGHCCITAQSGDLLDLAQVARESWLRLAGQAGFFAVESGALAVARSAEEAAVLDELSATREAGQVHVVTPDEVQQRLGGRMDDSVVAGAVLRDDLRVDPREAVASIAAWLAERPDVRILWRTTFRGAADGIAETSRGRIRAERTIVCVGHDLDQVYPQLADDHQVERCGLQMARVVAPGGVVVAPAVLTGTSMLRYPAFAETAAAASVRAEIERNDPALLDIVANVMFTQRPDGSLIVGDSHRYGVTMDPFLDEETSRVLLDRVGAVLGTPDLRVIERWQGIYASSPQHPYLVEEVAPGVTAVSVTSGVGMTISHGIAARFFRD